VGSKAGILCWRNGGKNKDEIEEVVEEVVVVVEEEGMGSYEVVE